MNIANRFIQYAMIDTESIADSNNIPSTNTQFDLARLLKKQLENMGATDIFLSEYASLYAKIPANTDCKTIVGFCSHLDTSPDITGKNVKPRIEANYNGGDIKLNETTFLSPKDYPSLLNYKGDDIIVTDGTTLLGSDDKAGIAAIMDMVQYLHEHPKFPHGEIQLFFPCDEEVGCIGASHVDKLHFNPDFAYTLDSDGLGEITYECFNASEANIEISGIGIHPGQAKNKMINSIIVAGELLAMLPANERPEHTELFEGFFHVLEFNGSVEKTNITILIRDHNKKLFENKKELLTSAVAHLNTKYQNSIKLNIVHTYNNMGELIVPKYEIVQTIVDAMNKVGVTPKFMPMRGGTDGSILTFMGIPTPNICTGGHNFHSRFEYVPVQSMEKISKILISMIEDIANR